jgi:hypothetical protein
MGFSIQIDITRKAWLENPKLRWQAGLEKAGIAWRNSLQPSNYGSTGSDWSTYSRTGTLADKSNFIFPAGEGEEVDFISVFYLSYLLHGTGIYGPSGMPIVPVTAQALAWPNNGNVSLLNADMSPRAASSKRSRKSVSNMVFARSVKGSIWPGKLEELIQDVTAGFKEGVINFEGE